MKPCELCDNLKATRRSDNIHVCDKCNIKYPKKRILKGLTKENK